MLGERATNPYLRQPEIEHLHHAVGGDLDIGGLQVPMNDPFLVRRLQRVGTFSGRGPKLVLGEESGKSRSSQSAGRSYGAEAVPETQEAEDRDHKQCSDRS